MKHLFFSFAMLTAFAASANTLTELADVTEATVCANLEEAQQLAVGTIAQVENVFYEVVDTATTEAQVTEIADEATDVAA